MRFIDSNVEIIEQEPGLLGIYKQIEKAARLSYKSEDKITEVSAKSMVETLVKNKHFACLEHGTIYLQIPIENNEWKDIYDGYDQNPYSKLVVDKNMTLYITTNARVLVENDWLDDLQYMCEPTEYHAKRISVKFTTSIGITRELIRHRAFSFMNESTRFCNYSKGRFGSELTFVIPEWIYDVQSELSRDVRWPTYEEKTDLLELTGQNLIDALSCEDRGVSTWVDCLERIETDYMYLTQIDEHYLLKAQEARGILPMDTKSEIIMTGFVEDWIHFFRLRSYIAATGKPHPDIQKLADMLMQDFIDNGYCTYEQIKEDN